MLPLMMPAEHWQKGAHSSSTVATACASDIRQLLIIISALTRLLYKGKASTWL